VIDKMLNQDSAFYNSDAVGDKPIDAKK